MATKRGKPNVLVTILLYMLIIGLGLFFASVITIAALAISDLIFYPKSSPKVTARPRGNIIERINWTFASIVFAVSFIVIEISIFRSGSRRNERDENLLTEINLNASKVGDNPKAFLDDDSFAAEFSLDETRFESRFNVKRMPRKNSDESIITASVGFKLNGCNEEFIIEQKETFFKPEFELLSIVPPSDKNATPALDGKYDYSYSNYKFFNNFLADDEIIEDLLSNHKKYGLRTRITFRNREFLMECWKEVGVDVDSATEDAPKLFVKYVCPRAEILPEISGARISVKLDFKFMRKFLAVVRHEYKKIVYKWAFLVGTLLFPLIAACFAIVPAIIFSIKGEATRIVVVDESKRIAPRLKENLSPERISEKIEKAAKDSATDLNASQEEKMKRGTQALAESFVFTDYDADGKALEQIRRELNGKITAGEIDAYLIIPPNVEATDAKFEFFSRKAGDFIANDTLRDALNEAVRSQRLADANISEERLKELSRNVEFTARQLDDSGNETGGDGAFFASLIIGLMIYITLAIYGNVIMGAVVEEKETRIMEILFSSAKPFELLMGKLVGVALAGLTQLAIWIFSALIIAGIGLAQMSTAGIAISIPNITPLMVIYFFIFFLLGFFIYASIFALIGSMVTSMQEGGQFAFPPVMILLIGFYFSIAVMRDPNSTLSFWVSIMPFFAPITMPVRILAETPPFWQIALAIFVNAAAIAALVWLASRVYRVGMLMYGKRATIPEVWKWIRQS